MSASPPRGCLQELLGVFDSLEVGPVRVEPRGLVCRYAVKPLAGSAEGRMLPEGTSMQGASGQTDTIDLIYRYEQEVFDPGEPVSRNLAAMIGAQVALNYGLFCRRIRFHGELDEGDLRFLRAMAENTAREIYVNKLLRPNPMLIGPVSRLHLGPPERRTRYCLADLEADAFRRRAPAAGGESGWAADPSRHAVLSSGGKESLLTYGLLRELGAEVHPIYVNESGRHWYTALNAYRSFRLGSRLTSRVWTNSDRVFAWMARRLPFVRPDHLRLRSDEYPIRLWTVGVFLFGALPLLRRRGIGRLLVGDEHDTTRRLTFASLGHYDGLYDQSLDFDRELTLCFRRKGWGVHVFSILRPLSEILGLKILTERYPELQRVQVSCHAGHIRDGRVYPCGKCEKCRRVVGMLRALGADPGRCGYACAQVAACLADLEHKGTTQEPRDAEDLLLLLNERKAAVSTRAAEARRRLFTPRLDLERSPPEEIPADLREPLLEIYRAHACADVPGGDVPLGALTPPGSDGYL